MALDLIEKEIKKAIKESTDEERRKALNSQEIHEATIRSAELIPGLQEGLSLIAKLLEADGAIESDDRDLLERINTKDRWRYAINTTFRQLGTDPKVTINEELHAIKDLYQTKPAEAGGVYILKGSNADNFTFRVYGSNFVSGTIGIKKFCERYREAVWDTWRKQNITYDGLRRELNVENQLPSVSLDPSKGGVNIQATLGRKTPFAHSNSTTVGKYRLENLIENLQINDDMIGAQATLNTNGIRVDIFEDIKNSLRISFQEDDVKMPDGGTRITRVVKGAIVAPAYNQKLPSDWVNLKKELLSNLGNFLKRNRKLLKQFDPAKADKALGSPSARERASTRAAEKIVDNIIVKNPRAKLIKGKKAKKPSIKKITVGLQGSSTKAFKNAHKKIDLFAGASATVKTKKKRATQEKGSDRALELHKLKQRINRRLPAEVRRNMGRPALRNQTGTFSNSVRLETLRDAQKTIVGEYTYQLSPYETFENTGQRRWPSGYNPKPLITKSIRNLAQGIVEDKFTLRRV